jgi:hypothetical protein
MTFLLRSWRVSGLALLLAALALSGGPGPAGAGDGAVLHVGETTTVQLDGTGWALDRGKSQQAQLVAVQSAGASAASQTFSLRGLKPGQATLVFRSGRKTFRASIDVLR